MENIITIISVSCTALGFLATAVTFIARFIKSAKDKKTAQDFNRLCDTLMPLIRKAESFVHYTGLEKKEYALTKANQFAIENKILFDTKLVGEKIEELVRLTREVNFMTNLATGSPKTDNTISHQKFTIGVKAS